MTTPEQDINELEDMNEETPIIPPWVLLGLAIVSVVVGIAIAIIQGEFGFPTGASLLIALIALFAWALMFPQQVLDIIKGRGFAFGGTAILMTVVLVIAAGFIYAVIKQQNWNTDLSERDLYSLDEEVSDVLAQMAQDPRIPPVTFIGIYGAANADTRDRFDVLFTDMANVADGKISHRFVDPNRDVRFLEQYTQDDSATSRLRAGQVIVAVDDSETGQPSTERFEVVFAGDAAQFDLINAMLNVSAVGDFRAYFLTVSGGIDMTDASEFGASRYAGDLEDITWTVEQVNPLQISGDAPQYTLNDPASNGEVIMIAGGAEPLDDTTVQTLQDYTAEGGDLIILGDINTSGGVATAQAENLANFLWENYGVRLGDDLVLDPNNTAFGNPESIVIRTYGTHQIVQGLSFDDDWLVMESAHSVEIADPVPEGVTVTILASTSDAGYTKTGLDFSTDFTSDDLALTPDDMTGEIPVAVAVENMNTGSRLVLFGSDALLKNTYRTIPNIVSPEVVTSAVIWAADAQNFADDLLRITPDPPTQDTPLFVQQSDMGWIMFVSLFLLPFGSLGLGLFVWWIQRKAQAVS